MHRQIFFQLRRRTYRLPLQNYMQVDMFEMLYDVGPDEDYLILDLFVYFEDVFDSTSRAFVHPVFHFRSFIYTIRL